MCTLMFHISTVSVILMIYIYHHQLYFDEERYLLRYFTISDNTAYLGAFLRIIIQDEEETNDQRISWITILCEQERLALCVRRFLSIVGIFSGFQLC